MDNNPWKIDCIEAFLFFNCPECAFIAKEKNFFQDHAKDNHPQSYVLFGGKIEKIEDHKTLKIEKCEPEDIEGNLSNDDQDQSQIENVEAFTGKYEGLQFSNDDTTDPLAVGRVIKFSNISNLINLEQTSDMAQGPEEKFNNLKWNAEITPVDKKEQKMQKNSDETKSINEGKLECSTCNKCFSEKQSLNRHIQSVHENKKTLECTSCMKRFSRMDHLKLHIACVHDNKKEFMCLICKKGFSRKDKLNNHILLVHEKEKSYQCDTCKCFFSTKQHLKRHIEIVHDENKPNKKIYKLKNKDKKNIGKYESSTEINNVQSNLDNVLDPIPVEPSKATKQCSKIEENSNKGKQLIWDILIYDKKYNKNLERQSGCGKSTKKIHEKSRKNLKMPDFAKAIKYSQIQKKTKELPWCHVCKINFNLEKELKDHIKSTHAEEKPYKCHQCPFCDKKMSREKTLKDHISSVHEKEKLYQCHTCENFFSYKQHLKRHIEMVHEKKKPFKCSTCERCFSQTHLLNRHIETVHEGIIFECVSCDARYSRKDKLKKHMDEKHKNPLENKELSDLEKTAKTLH